MDNRIQVVAMNALNFLLPKKAMITEVWVALPFPKPKYQN